MLINLFFIFLSLFTLLNIKSILPLTFYISGLMFLNICLNWKINLPKNLLYISIFWFFAFLFIPLIFYINNSNFNFNYIFVFNILPFLNLIIPVIFLRQFKLNYENLGKLIFISYALIISSFVIDNILHNFNSSLLLLFWGETFADAGYMIENGRVTGFFQEPSNAAPALVITFLVNRFIHYNFKNKYLNLFFNNNLISWTIFLIFLSNTGSASAVLALFLSISSVFIFRNILNLKIYNKVVKYIFTPSKRLKFLIIIIIISSSSFFLIDLNEQYISIYKNYLISLLVNN